MRRIGWLGGLCILLLVISIPAFGDMIITKSGSVLQGTIEFGIPNVISVTSDTGDIFTVQRSNIKAIRFSDEGGKATVETFDGNILVGTVGGIPEVIGLRTPAGDVQSVKLTSIQEIRFPAPGQPPAATTATATTSPPAATTGTPGASPKALAGRVKDAYDNGRWGFTLGLDTGLQLGFSSLNGFGMPTASIGVNLLNGGGIVWRSYFVPSGKWAEKTALQIAQDTPGIAYDDLLAETMKRAPIASFYFHLGTNWIIWPEAGLGVLFHLTPNIHFDLGGALDILGFPWLSIGILITF